MQYADIRNKCLKCIDAVFNDLTKKGFIDPESKFFRDSKEAISTGCFYYLYPLIEFDISSKINFDFSLHLVYLHAYTHFLDQSLDSLENNPSTKTISFQISTYLLLNYLEWLIKTYNLRTRARFYGYYEEYTKYLITEKRWEFPHDYLAKYGSARSIHKKALLSLFPLELCREDSLTSKEVRFLKDIFINYFSFALLADDLVDLDFDINHHCLTYPIAKYLKLKGNLPQSANQVTFLMPQMVIILKKCLDNIKKLETDMGKHSVIINNRISLIKEHLNQEGIEL